MQASGSVSSWNTLPLDECHPQGSMSQLIAQHDAGDYKHIPFLIAIIEKNSTRTVSTGVTALEYYVPSTIARIRNGDRQERKFTKIDFIELPSLRVISSIAGTDQNRVDTTINVRGHVYRYAFDGAWYRIEYVKSKTFAEIEADPWLAACLQDKITDTNASDFMSLAQSLFHKSDKAIGVDKPQALRLLSHTVTILSKVCTFNPKQPGANGLLSTVTQKIQALKTAQTQ